MRLYVSGPYRAATIEQRDRNIAYADEVARQLLLWGHSPFCPHTMTKDWENDPNLVVDDFLRCDCDWVAASDGIVRLPGDSKGADIEVQCAADNGKPVYYWPQDAELLESMGAG